MNKKLRWLMAVMVALACVAESADLAQARGGRGGGGRPSMGRVGGGGGRPSMGGGMSHSRPQMSRPSVQRPSMGNASRPSGGSRPNFGSGSSLSNFHPSGGRPSLPTSRPGGSSAANRPQIRPPSNVTRPSFPSGGVANRPSLGDRPSAGVGTRPSPGVRPGGDRPSLGGGDRPSFGNVDRPAIGGGNRPGGGDRPTIGGGNRPNRPGGGDRPTIGGGDRPGRPGGGDRPVIGGGDRPGRPGGGNINIGNDINIGGGNVIGNRPNWDRPNWNNPGWGWGGGGWAGNWHDHCIRPHYGWYNGCWTGYWGSNWYAPLAWGAVGWGLGALTSGWGYGTSYYNPYYDSAAAVPYDYSQPVVVNNYIASDESGAAEAPQETPATQQATELFDQGLAQFKAGDYQAALAKFNAALEKLPGDPVVHEVRALTLFALGDYQQAAAALNSFLSSAPGMDWTTLSSLYGDSKDYEAQLRKLEQFCSSNPKDAAAYFVLAYQYLVIGDKNAAVSALQVVVKDQPEDVTAKRMLDALTPAAPPAAAVADTPPAPSDDAPQTDLVGKWQAKAAGTTIDLSITDDSQFTWTAKQPGKPDVKLAGQLSSTSDEIALASKDQGTMSGSVKSLGPNEWQFVLSGAPPSDPGLKFERVN